MIDAIMTQKHSKHETCVDVDRVKDLLKTKNDKIEELENRLRFAEDFVHKFNRCRLQSEVVTGLYSELEESSLRYTERYPEKTGDKA